MKSKQNAAPQIDISCGGHAPILGALYHAPGAIARHDAVAWGYGRGADQRAETVEILDLDERRCDAPAVRRMNVNVDVRIAAQASFLHVAVGNIQIRQQQLELIEIRVRLLSGTDVGLRNNLQQRSAGAVQVDEAVAAAA